MPTPGLGSKLTARVEEVEPTILGLAQKRPKTGFGLYDVVGGGKVLRMAKIVAILTNQIHWAQLVAVLTAAWVLWLFIIHREAEPGAELDFNVDFVRRQDQKWLIEIEAKMTNRSQVRNWYRDFRIVVRYFLPEDDAIHLNQTSSAKGDRGENLCMPSIALGSVVGANRFSLARSHGSRQNGTHGELR
jgi:hypothetical protein